MAQTGPYRLTADQQARYGLFEVGFVNDYRGDGWVPNRPERFERAAGALVHYFKAPATAQGWYRQLTNLVQSALARRVHYREILDELALIGANRSEVTQIRQDQLSWLFLTEEEVRLLPQRQQIVAGRYAAVRDPDKLKTKIQLSKSIGLIGRRNPSASLACLVAADSSMASRQRRVIQAILPSHCARESWVAGLALGQDGAMTRAVRYLAETEAVTVHDFRAKLEPIFLQPANRWSNYVSYLFWQYGYCLEGEVRQWAIEAAYFETRLESYMLAPFDKVSGDSAQKFSQRPASYLAKLRAEMHERMMVLEALTPMGPAYEGLFRRLEDEYGNIMAGYELGDTDRIWLGCMRIGLVWRLRSLANEAVRLEWFGFSAAAE
jgi:hypothetical protein